MQYSDERIIPLTMNQKEQQIPMSLETGYYINGRLVKFIKMELIDKKIIADILRENMDIIMLSICILEMYQFRNYCDT